MSSLPVIHEIALSNTIQPTPIFGQIGWTPLLQLANLDQTLSPDVELYAKAEWYNPGGSVKDRPAANIIRRALDEGQLHADTILLDATSGNMGIAYATLSASLGLPVHLIIPENASAERIKIMRALGASLTLSNPLEGSEGARAVAEQMAAREPARFFYANQYNNRANWEAHYQSTGPEIYDQTAGRITHVVAGLGTSGTLMGAGRYLKLRNPAIQLIAVQPDSPYHGLEGLKHMPSSKLPGIYNPDLVDEMIAVGTGQAYDMARRLAREEGLMVGVSAAAAIVAALQVSAKLENGVVVAIQPDSAHKYLGHSFWEAT